MKRLLVIKIGGNIIDDQSKLDAFLKEFASMDEPRILVHGGGKLATRLAEQLQIPQQIVEGRRITDAETLKIVTMVYAGYINKNIVAGLQHYGCNAIGISGADGNSILAHKREKGNTDYGFAGDIDQVNGSFLETLLDSGSQVVVAPITHNGHGQLLNTNADTIAQEIAAAMSGIYDTDLIYGFEKAGVLLDANDDATVIPDIRPGYYQQLRKENRIFAGMIPKLDNAFGAIGRGVRNVRIGSAESLKELAAGKAGTTIHQ